MVEEKDLDVIEKAHQAAARLEKANEAQAALIQRMEDVERRAEGRRLLSGESSAGQQPVPELSEEAKLKIDGRNYFKGGLLEKVFQ